MEKILAATIIILALILAGCDSGAYDQYPSANKVYNITIDTAVRDRMNALYTDMVHYNNTYWCIYSNADIAKRTYQFVSIVPKKQCVSTVQMRVSDTCTLNTEDKGILQNGAQMMLIQCGDNTLIIYDKGMRGYYKDMGMMT